MMSRKKNKLGRPRLTSRLPFDRTVSVSVDRRLASRIRQVAKQEDLALSAATRLLIERGLGGALSPPQKNRK
jgi:hypothetical protein